VADHDERHSVDFSLNEEQQAAIGLAVQILGDLATPERLTEVEATEQRFDAELWDQLARADLLGLCLPERDGGGGFGFLEACLLLVEHGRSVAPIGWWAHQSAALALARLGTEQARDAWLPDAIAGRAMLTVALAEVAGSGSSVPPCRAIPSGPGDTPTWTFRGSFTAVPYGHVAGAAVVPATLPGGDHSLFVVPLDDPSVQRQRQDTFDHQPQVVMTVDGPVAGAARLGGGPDALGWLCDRATVAVCAVAAGVADRGLRITAQYTTERHQFDRPIATFQAVGQRMADGFIDAQAMHLTMLAAATLLDAERPAVAEVAVAKYWASRAGSRVGHTGLHVHGGISIDLDYAIHRYFLWSKQLELTLGPAAAQLAGLGTHLARTAP
jgi:3-oxocholest-4-en-26-oyl-CoA dehydrogenase beta subunit